MTPPPLLFACDRLEAAMRAGWRSMGAALLLGAASLVVRARDWPLLWRTDPASCLALGCTAAVLGVAGVGLAGASLRWLLLAIWPAPVGVSCDAGALWLRFGPFGVRGYDWVKIRVIESDDDELLIAAELTTPHILHPDHPGDLSETITRYCRVAPADWRALLAARSVPPARPPRGAPP